MLPSTDTIALVEDMASHATKNDDGAGRLVILRDQSNEETVIDRKTGKITEIILLFRIDGLKWKLFQI